MEWNSSVLHFTLPHTDFLVAMPQDKRLIITKAVLYKLQRVCGNDDAASKEGLFLEFILPSVVQAQVPELKGGHIFHLSHKVYPCDGRSTCLIVPKAISADCFKINKRHGYYDAVVTAEAICKRGDPEAAKRAVRVANTFSHFVADARIAGRLPACILSKVKASTGATSTSESSGSNGRAASSSAESCPTVCLTTLTGLGEEENLTFRLSQGATGGVMRHKKEGQLLFRVGHGGMTAGEICENAKNFIFTLKKNFPTVWKYIFEFKLTTNKTESIRFMEVQIQR